MKHVSILIPQGHISLVNVEGTHQIFSQVNDFLKSRGKTSLFKVELVSAVRENDLGNGRFRVMPDKNIGEVKKTDLIIIPAVHGDQKEVQQLNQELTPWIIRQYKEGAEIVSFCIGAFFLASTGLLKGKRCATQ